MFYSLKSKIKESFRDKIIIEVKQHNVFKALRAGIIVVNEIFLASNPNGVTYITPLGFIKSGLYHMLYKCQPFGLNAGIYIFNAPGLNNKNPL